MYRLWRVIFAIGLTALLTISVFAQNASSDGSAPLGDVARQTRQQSRRPAVRVITDDNLRRERPPESPSSTAAEADVTPAGEKSGEAENKEKKVDGEQPEKKAGKTDEEQAEENPAQEKPAKQDGKGRGEALQGSYAEQKSRLALLQRDLDVTQRDLRYQDAKFYADAGNSLRDPKNWAQQRRTIEEHIAKTQQEIQQVQENLSKLQEEAQQAGIPLGE